MQEHEVEKEMTGLTYSLAVMLRALLLVVAVRVVLALLAYQRSLIRRVLR